MKILLVGLGSIGQRHVRNLRSVLGTSAELIAYRVRGLSHVLTADMRIEVGEDVETKYGVTACASLDAALAQQPDAVFVTNPNSLHIPVALAAARAGCHLFIEKPISHTLEGIDELIDEVDRQQLVCLVGYQWRFHPALALVRCRIASSAIGPLLSARLDFGEHLGDWHPYEDYRSMPVSRRDLGGGVILAQIHDLDYAYWLFGMPRRIAAMGGHLTSLEIDVEDVADILMECESAGRGFPVYVHQDCVRRPPARGCSIDGEHGSIRLDLLAQTVHVSDREGRQVESHSFAAHERNDMFLDELRHFLACVRGEATPIVTARDATMSLRMARAALDSMASGRMVEFP